MRPPPRHRSARALLALAAATPAIAPPTTHAAPAPPKPDCPAAFTPYSADTLLLDLLLDPRSAAAVTASGLLDTLPPPLRSTHLPSFAAILTPRALVANSPFPIPNGAQRLPALDRALRRIPITAAAAERRCARYDHVPPALPPPAHHPALLVFEKITGYRHDSVPAADAAIAAIAARHGWSITVTANAAVFNRAQLQNYQAVVWNNVSGDALTLPQQAAFKAYLRAGGGFAGIHAAAGDPVYLWPWYQTTLIGARFIGHPLHPQFQPATIETETPRTPITAPLPATWRLTEEWYSFAPLAPAPSRHILARVDERTYAPGPLAMGPNHPIAWTTCINNGRAFYTAIGHLPATYTNPAALTLLDQGLTWSAGAGPTRCANGTEHEMKPT